MAITAIEDFISTLAAISISGVKRQYGSPPKKLAAADLPASYPRAPQSEEFSITGSDHGGWPKMTAELVLVYEAVNLDTPDANFKGALAAWAIMSTAFRNLPLGLNTGALGKSKLDVEMRQDVTTIGGIAYWAVTATVTGYG